MKRRSCEYDYVEVMACPSGCLNGGGQLKAGDRQSQQQLLDQLDAIYHEPEVCACALPRPVRLLNRCVHTADTRCMRSTAPGKSHTTKTWELLDASKGQYRDQSPMCGDDACAV